eukprot:g3601.t1
MLLGDKSEVIIENSRFINNSARTNGAVLSTEDNGGAHLSIADSRFEGNVAEYHGGAIYINKSLGLNVSDTLFQNNACHLGKGGAIFVLSSNDSVAQIRRSIFKRNSANGVMGMGGAIAFGYTGKHVERALEISDDVLFLKNTARVSGGAVIVYDTDATVHVLSTFVGNSAQGAAGGLHLMFPDDRLMTGGYTNAALSTANFFSNVAHVRAGGAMFVYSHILLRMSNSNFTENNAERGGAMYLDNTKKPINISSSDFMRNTVVTSGGSIHLQGTTNIAVIDSSFKHNAGKRGGALSAIGGKTLEVTYCMFENNSAHYGGGAINLESSETERGKELKTTMMNSTFLNNKSNVTGSRDGFGGALRLSGAGVETTLLNCHFESNEAKWGGSVYIDEAFETEMHNTSYSKNAADLGGAIYVVPLERKLCGKNDLTKLISCVLNENEAKGGGAIFARPDRPYSCDMFASPNPSLTMIDCSLLHNRADEFGGGLFLAFVNVNIETCTFRSNTAKESNASTIERVEGIMRHSGGAVYVSSGSFISLSDTKFVSNNATGRGGAVCVADALFNCTNNCTLEENEAHNGGAIYCSVSSDEAHFGHFPVLNCTNCSLYSNKANRGGGIYTSYHGAIQCIDNQNTCQEMNENTSNDEAMAQDSFQREIVVILKDMKVENNKAANGNDIFSNCPRTIGIIRQLKSDNLVQYVKNTPNEQSYIYNVSSSACRIECENHSLVDLNRWDTSKEMSQLAFKILDCFGQPATNARIVAELTAYKNGVDCCNASKEVNMSFEGERKRVTDNATLNFGGLNISNGKDGSRNQTLCVSFDDEGEEHVMLNSILINISFRECFMMMEKTDSDTGNCKKCEPGQHYDHNHQTCKNCPENANCGGLWIIPHEGFWHATSVSNDIRECRPKEACTKDIDNNRRDAAIKAHEHYTILSYNDTSYNQCDKGYRDLICGSCETDYGRWNRYCVKCNNVEVMWMSFLATIVWNLFVLMVFIFSARNLIARVHFNQQVTAQREIEMTQRGSRNAQEEFHSFPQLQRHNSSPISAPQFAHSSSDRRSVLTEIRQSLRSTRSVLRWRRFQETIASEPLPLANPLSEALKIVLNFMQVIYLAGLLSEDLPSFFKWSLIPFDSLNLTETVFLVTDCLLKPTGDRAVIRMTLQALFPVFLFLLICLLPTVLLLFKRNIKFGIKEVQLVALCTIYLYFGPEIRTLLTFLDNVNIEDGNTDLGASNFWFYDTSVSFMQGPHAYVVGLIVLPVLIALTIGFPFALFFTLKKQKDRMHEEEVVSSYGFLYKGYDAEHYYWETVIFVRKIVIAALSVFVQNPELQSIFISIVLMFFLSLQLTIHPFTSSFPALNRLETLSLTVSFLVFSGVSLMLSSNALNKDKLVKGIGWVLILVLMGTVLLMVFGLIGAGRDFINDKMIEKGLYPDKSSLESVSFSTKIARLMGFYIKAFLSRAKATRNERNADNRHPLV